MFEMVMTAILVVSTLSSIMFSAGAIRSAEDKDLDTSVDFLCWAAVGLAFMIFSHGVLNALPK